MPPPRRVRSQFPRDSTEKHVEFILVAAFDIDRGSIMEHQYPGAISGDETMLAELMLPDGVHGRSQDWTMFFLHKDAETSSSTSPTKEGFDDEQNGVSEAEREDDEAAAQLEGAPLIYVLNHVNTKHDENTRRGAIVKAMAICTRHSFVDIFKPVLVLAIEEYYKSPTIATLERLYDSLNSMDLSLMPRLSTLEKQILHASSAKDIFLEKFERLIMQRKDEDGYLGAGMIERARPGDHTPQQSQLRYMLPRDTHEFESRINFNGHSLPVKIPTARTPETVGNFSIIKLIQTFSAPHAKEPQPFALHAHLTTGGAFTHPIIVLVNALLTQKRVIFLGHGRPAEEVAEAVLAACSMASGGVLRGFVRHAFPYTDLTKVEDLQRVPGFIAGVTNPIFASTPKWWDLLCDLPSGRMKISSSIDQPLATEGYLQFQQQNPAAINLAASNAPGPHADSTGDAAHMEAVLRNISSRLGESVIRNMWRDWVIKFTRIASAFEENVYGTSALLIGGLQTETKNMFKLSGHGYVWRDEDTRLRELAGNASRIEAWRQTRSYFYFKTDILALHKTKPIKEIDLAHQIDQLRFKSMTQLEAQTVFQGLAELIRSEAEINQLLVATSEGHGGLFYVSLGMMHPRVEVRRKTTELLDRIGSHEAGKHFWRSLSKFSQLAYFRNRQETASIERGWENSLLRVISNQ